MTETSTETGRYELVLQDELDGPTRVAEQDYADERGAKRAGAKAVERGEAHDFTVRPKAVEFDAPAETEPETSGEEPKDEQPKTDSDESNEARKTRVQRKVRVFLSGPVADENGNVTDEGAWFDFTRGEGDEAETAAVRVVTAIKAAKADRAFTDETPVQVFKHRGGLFATTTFGQLPAPARAELEAELAALVKLMPEPKAEAPVEDAEPANA